MRKRMKVAIIVVLLCVIQLSIVQSDETEWMPDAALRAIVRETLGLEADESLYKTDMQDLIVLDAPSRNIGSLQGLHYALYLEKLKVWDNNISYVPPLIFMQDLVTVRISNNPLGENGNHENLRHIVTSPSIKRLAIRNTGITDCAPLLDLSNLYWLRIRDNELANAHVLANLPALTNIDIDIPETEDTTSPTAELVRTTTPSVFGGNYFSIRMAASEPILNFESTDVRIVSGATVTFSHLTSTRETFFLHYEVDREDLPCSVTVSVPAGVFTDDAGNENTASNTLTFVVSASESED